MNAVCVHSQKLDFIFSSKHGRVDVTLMQLPEIMFWSKNPVEKHVKEEDVLEKKAQMVLLTPKKFRFEAMTVGFFALT